MAVSWSIAIGKVIRLVVGLLVGIYAIADAENDIRAFRKVVVLVRFVIFTEGLKLAVSTVNGVVWITVVGITANVTVIIRYMSYWACTILVIKPYNVIKMVTCNERFAAAVG